MPAHFLRTASILGQRKNITTPLTHPRTRRQRTNLNHRSTLIKDALIRSSLRGHILFNYKLLGINTLIHHGTWEAFNSGSPGAPKRLGSVLRIIWCSTSCPKRWWYMYLCWMNTKSWEFTEGDDHMTKTCFMKNLINWSSRFARSQTSLSLTKPIGNVLRFTTSNIYSTKIYFIKKESDKSNLML